MLIDLSEVLSEPHKSIDEVVGTEMKEVKVNGSRFPVSRTQPVHIHVEYAGEKKLHISCETSLTVIIPCDRCLTDVPTDFTLSFEKQVNTALADGEDDGESDEANYIDGYHLDVEQLLYNEILVGWPMKVLCSEDCKGICSVCGRTYDATQSLQSLWILQQERNRYCRKLIKKGYSTGVRRIA